MFYEIDEYCKELRKYNIDVVAVSLVLLFCGDNTQLYWQNVQQRHDFLSKYTIKREMIDYFKGLFKKLDEQKFKIAIVVPLLGNTYKDLYSAAFEDNPYAKTNGCFKKYSDKLLKNASVSKIIEKINVKVVPDCTHTDPGFYNSYIHKLSNRQIMHHTRFLHPSIIVSLFLEGAFNIPIYRCVVIGNCDYRRLNCSRVFASPIYPHDICIAIHVMNLITYNFTNVCLNKSNKIEHDEKVFPGDVSICVIIDEELISEEQLNLARCLDYSSLIVLTDDIKNKWENGVLYCNRDKYAQNHITFTFEHDDLL